jgi:hypothetical protein
VFQTFGTPLYLAIPEYFHGHISMTGSGSVTWWYEVRVEACELEGEVIVIEYSTLHSI